MKMKSSYMIQKLSALDRGFPFFASIAGNPYTTITWFDATVSHGRQSIAVAGSLSRFHN
jgi:hypothetical protein